MDSFRSSDRRRLRPHAVASLLAALAFSAAVWTISHGEAHGSSALPFLASSQLKEGFLRGNVTQHLRAKVKSDALSHIISKHLEGNFPKFNLTEHKKSVSTARNQTSLKDDKRAVHAHNTSGHGVFNSLQNGKKKKLKSSEAKDAPLIPSKLSKELTHVISKIVQQAAEVSFFYRLFCLGLNSTRRRPQDRKRKKRNP